MDTEELKQFLRISKEINDEQPIIMNVPYGLGKPKESIEELKDDYIKMLEEANKDLKENRQVLLKEIEELKNLNSFLKETQLEAVKKHTEEMILTESLKEEIEGLKRP